jgi:hypothetical protein
MPSPTAGQKALALAMVLCYAVGYPWAIAGHSADGWLLVMLGGLLLVVLLFVTVRRLTAVPSAGAEVMPGQPAEHRRDISSGPGPDTG